MVENNGPIDVVGAASEVNDDVLRHVFSVGAYGVPCSFDRSERLLLSAGIRVAAVGRDIKGYL